MKEGASEYTLPMILSNFSEIKMLTSEIAMTSSDWLKATQYNRAAKTRSRTNYPTKSDKCFNIRTLFYFHLVSQQLIQISI